MRSEAEGLHARNIANAIGKLALKSGNLAMCGGAEFIPVGVSRRQRETRGEDVRSLESWRDL